MEIVADCLDRVEKLLFRIDKSMKILEVGPGWSPVTPRSKGWNSWTVDHADQETLREKYRSTPGVDVSQIQPVDFVWTSGDLDTAVPCEHHRSFDACIASHVLEHFPDLLSFFSSLDIILKPNAIISVAVPDKRFCYDYFKPVSMTSDFLYASANHARRHTKKTAFENIAYNVGFNDRIAWGQHPVCDLNFLNSLVDAKMAFDQTDDSQDAAYVDYHAWYFTPQSFKLILLELNYLGLVRWLLDVDFPTVGCEFFATLKKGRVEAESEAQLSKMRLELMQGIVKDLKVQGGYLVQSQENVCPIAAADSLVVDGTLAEVTRMLAVLDSRQAELMLLIQKQGARIDKISEIAGIIKKIIHPIRSVSRLRRR